MIFFVSYSSPRWYPWQRTYGISAGQKIRYRVNTADSSFFIFGQNVVENQHFVWRSHDICGKMQAIFGIVGEKI
jgi:hypothetical protein